jgi:hypothetical protein
MKRFILPALVFSLIVSASAGAAEIAPVTLRIEGIHDEADGKAVARALAEVPNTKVVDNPTPKKPLVMVVSLRGATYDVGDLARAVAGTRTPNRDKGAPSAVLVLRYERLDGNALSDEAFLPGRVEPAFAKLKGVVAKKCKLDTKARELHIKLDDKGGAKLSEIKAVFPGLKLE